MKEKDRTSFDDFFQDKIYNLDADVDVPSWDMLEKRLPRKKIIPFYRNPRYIAAAASFAILLTLGALYRAADIIPQEELLQAQNIQHEVTTESPTLTPTAPSPAIPLIAEAKAKAVFSAPINKARRSVKRNVAVAKKEAFAVPQAAIAASSEVSHPVLMASSSSPITKSSEKVSKPTRRWSFGMGGGSISSSSSAGGLNGVPFSDVSSESLGLPLLKSPAVSYNTEELDKIDIKHKMPISFGLGVNYHLNNRWSLQSGLQYSLLKSEWNTNLIYDGQVEQSLHFIGIPLFANYKIAEWKRIRFYASAGVLAELNVAGSVRSKVFDNESGDLLFKLSEHRRMKEIQWSAHAAIGASYPLLRFVSVYAEAGAGYYMDNGSTIETYYTDKEFMPNLRLGFRFGF